MENNDLITKYRPNTFEEVIGQEKIVASLKALVGSGKKLPNCLLFSGPSGVGKTTLARICAKASGCLPENIKEINGANYTSIDDMRTILTHMQFLPLTAGSTRRVVIIDEVHRLSKQAFDSLLKGIEEPPVDASWILCSTEPHKIPSTIEGRSHHYKLKVVPTANLATLVTKVRDAEKLPVDNKIIPFIALRAAGSPRQALKFLSMARGCATTQDAVELIKASGDESEAPNVIALCQAMLFNKPWHELAALVKALGDEENETVRMIILAYMTKVVLSDPSDKKKAGTALGILKAFSNHPFNQSEKLAPILLAVAEGAFGE